MPGANCPGSARRWGGSEQSENTLLLTSVGRLVHLACEFILPSRRVRLFMLVFQIEFDGLADGLAVDLRGFGLIQGVAEELAGLVLGLLPRPNTARDTVVVRGDVKPFPALAFPAEAIVSMAAVGDMPDINIYLHAGRRAQLLYERRRVSSPSDFRTNCIFPS